MERWAVWAAWILVATLARPALAGRGNDPTALAAKLGGADVAAAVAAAQALGEQKSMAAENALLGSLGVGLAPEVAVAALDAVARRPTDKALPLLLAYAKNRNVAVRAHAVQALGTMTGNKAAGEAVLGALGDEDPAVRTAAGRSLAWRRDARAVSPLLALLAEGDEVAGPPLAALGDADAAGKVAALVGKIPDALVAHTLGAMAVRHDLGPEAAYLQTVRALGGLPGDEATAELRKIADSPTVPKAARRDAQTFLETRK